MFYWNVWYGDSDDPEIGSKQVMGKNKNTINTRLLYWWHHKELYELTNWQQPHHHHTLGPNSFDLRHWGVQQSMTFKKSQNAQDQEQTHSEIEGLFVWQQRRTSLRGVREVQHICYILRLVHEAPWRYYWQKTVMLCEFMSVLCQYSDTNCVVWWGKQQSIWSNQQTR